MHFSLLSSSLPLFSLGTRISYTSKYSEMRYTARHAWPFLFWYSVHHTFCRRSVDHINNTCNCFCPIPIRQVSAFEPASYHVHNCLVLSLCYTIMLRCVPVCKLSSDPMLFAIIMECLWVIFSTTIWPQYLDLSISGSLLRLWILWTLQKFQTSTSRSKPKSFYCSHKWKWGSNNFHQSTVSS